MSIGWILHVDWWLGGFVKVTRNLTYIMSMEYLSLTDCLESANRRWRATLRFAGSSWTCGTWNKIVGPYLKILQPFQQPRLGNMFLDQDEQLTTSSDDIKCFFYLVQVPRPGRKFMGFGRPVPKELLDDSFGDCKGYLVSRVLPMGWVNSVAIKPLRKHDVWWRASSLTPSLSRTLSTSRRRWSKGGLCSTVGLAQYWWELGLHAKASRASTLSVVGL